MTPYNKLPLLICAHAHVRAHGVGKSCEFNLMGGELAASGLQTLVYFKVQNAVITATVSRN